jgi:hypothetical protein
MPFMQTVIDYIDDYVNSHLPDKKWYEEYFSFINDKNLADRLTIEFKNTRYLYKLFEGLQAKDELLLAQVRTQIILYTSIYEAVIHYIIFEYYINTKAVTDLINMPQAIPISIPKVKKEKLESLLVHASEEIIPYVMRIKKRDQSKIRFDEKCEAFFLLGLIDEELKNELIYLYNIRNAVHIHAEIRKSLAYELDMSKKAYWRFEKFKVCIEKKLKEDSMI